MVCDVSLLLRGGQTALARHYYPQLKVKVSDEVYLELSSAMGATTRTGPLLIHNIPLHHLHGAAGGASTRVRLGPMPLARPHVTRKWDLGRAVATPCQGLYAGACAFIWEIFAGVVGLLLLPARGAQYAGPAGFAKGCAMSILLLVLRAMCAEMNDGWTPLGYNLVTHYSSSYMSLVLSSYSRRGMVQLWVDLQRQALCS